MLVTIGNNLRLNIIVLLFNLDLTLDPNRALQFYQQAKNMKDYMDKQMVK